MSGGHPRADTGPDPAVGAGPAQASDAAPATGAAGATQRLIPLLDPVTELVRGALPYHDAGAELPDDQPLPALRVRREVTAPGCQLQLEQRLGKDVLADEPLAIDRLPMDRAASRPRRRVHPAPSSVLTLRTDPELERARIAPVGEVAPVGPGGGADGAAASGAHTTGAPDGAAASGAHTTGAPDGAAASGVRTAGAPGVRPPDPDDEVALVPATGPGPRDVERIAGRARRHRYVALERPLDGDPVLIAALVLRVVGGGTPVIAAEQAAAGLDLLAPMLRTALVIGTAPATPAGTAHTATSAPGGGGPSTTGAGAPWDDDLAVASLAAEQKRLAWQHHDLTLAWGPAADDPGRWVPQLTGPRARTISVVLPTRRPSLVPIALAMLAGQREVDLEVVVALHGAGDPAVVERQLADHGLAGRAIGLPGSVPFGAVVDAAVSASSGELIHKWDDDDLYGPHHLVDLVVAQRQTGAGLVGKAPEFVHLDASNTTVWRTPGKAEATSLGLAGGTFLTPRAALEEIGGYPPVARAIDFYVKTRMQELGLGVFRTHAFGFALRRHGQGHTWEAEDDRFRKQAVRILDGLPPVLALGDAARFTPLAAVES